jgi:hypothetical protein
MPGRNIERKTSNSRLLKNYGSWLYCTGCQKTVAYICYSTYQKIELSFQCACGSNGILELKEAGVEPQESIESHQKLILQNNRYCCPADASPLFSVVAKQVVTVAYDVSCLKCQRQYKGFLSSS